MEALLSLAVSNAVVAALLAALASVVACFCRRPTVSHALWLLVLLKLITPPLVSLSVTWPRTEEVETPLAESPPPTVLLPLLSGAREPIVSDDETNLTSPQRQQGLPQQEPPDPPLLALRASEVLIVVWLGGSFVWWTAAAVRLRKFQRWLRQARPAPAEVRDQARRLAALLGLRHCPPIVFVEAPLSPMLWALGLSPRLLIPAELWRKLTVEQQETLLTHELAHLRRGDHWVRRLEFLVLGLYWWHPVVWWTRRRLQEAEEECCDALVVAALPDAASAYASALVETVAFLSQSRIAAPFGASGAGHVTLLKRRLTMILQDTSSRKPSRLAFWTVLGLGVLLLPLAPRAARTEAPDKPQGEEEKGVSLKSDISWLKPQGNPVAAEPDRTQEIEKLQDDIELLRLQVRLKESRLRGAKISLPLAQQRLEVTQGQHKQAITSAHEVLKAEMAVATLRAEIEAKELELQEVRLLLKHAERRLARLQRSSEKTDKSDRTPQEKRLRELERNVENLLKEIHNLRREMQPEKPGVPGKGEEKKQGQSLLSRQKRMLRWSMRFKNENAEEYVDQLR
ncbi:MAG: M56 family metallopeptidase [Gemmataceae bacterium]